MAKLSFFISLNLPGSGQCLGFWLKHLQCKVRTYFNDSAISQSHYDLMENRYKTWFPLDHKGNVKSCDSSLFSLFSYCTEINQN